MNTVRICLLRVLLGWWVILALWSIVWCMSYLMTGDIEDTTDMCKEMTHVLWFGKFRTI